MTITARVHDNRIELPPDIHLPDGTQVEIVLSMECEANLTADRVVHLPAFKGDGLMPGVKLGHSRSLRGLLRAKPEQGLGGCL